MRRTEPRWENLPDAPGEMAELSLFAQSACAQKS